MYQTVSEKINEKKDENEKDEKITGIILAAEVIFPISIFMLFRISA